MMNIKKCIGWRNTPKAIIWTYYAASHYMLRCDPKHAQSAFLLLCHIYRCEADRIIIAAYDNMSHDADATNNMDLWHCLDNEALLTES